MIISSAVRLLVLLTIMPCNDFFSVEIYLLLSHLSSAIKPPMNYFSLGTVPWASTGNFVLFGHQAVLTNSLLYFCLQVCHRMIQCSSAQLTERQWAIRITFVKDWLLIPTRWPSDWLPNGPASCYSKSVSTKPFVWLPIVGFLNYCLVTSCTHVDYWLPSSKCSECWHMLPSSSVL